MILFATGRSMLAYGETVAVGRSGVAAGLTGSATTEPADFDPALDAVRAMVAAAPLPLGVFDADGNCLTANRGFVLRGGGGGRETRTSFSPDQRRQWVLVGLAASAQPVQDTAFTDAVANALPVMFSAKDTESRYLFMNQYQATLYGTTPDGAVGRTAAELLDPDYGAATREIDERVIFTGQPTPFYDMRCRTADGIERQWLTSKVPLRREDGSVWGVATMSLDITDRSAEEQRLRAARDLAEAAARTRSGFLAAMSHELRTPLNAVIGFAEILQQEVLGPIGSPEYRDYAGHILRSGQHLLALINDILDYARIESGTLRLNLGDVDLQALIRGTLEALAPAAAAAGVALRADLAGAPVVIQADEQRLRQALLNVAGNAVKFTQSGGTIVIALSMAEGAAKICVSDSGIGIAEAQMSHIFEPFWQADSGLDRLREGAGIGLPLARQLVTLHGGELLIDSHPGSGTQVTLLLPSARPGAAVGSTTRAA
jgi:PAS domain S-box-containing protein